jgi:8-oxo-dGTP pyrophosphatase MutT (NUDIX family)
MIEKAASGPDETAAPKGRHVGEAQARGGSRQDRRPHRIAAGAIVVRRNQILLVLYRDPGGGTYLAAPGGGVREHESVADAAVRETFEETGLCVEPGRVLLIEDIHGCTPAS